MMEYMKMIVHALVLAVIVTVIGTIVHKLKIFKTALSPELKEKCRGWNANYSMQKSLFVVGAVASLVCSFASLQKRTD